MAAPSDIARCARYAPPLWALWLVPSLGQLVKHAGPDGAAGLAAVALTGIVLLLAGVASGRLKPSASWFVGLALVLSALFVVLYPLAQGGRFGGGSDRDEALTVAVQALLAGRNPNSVDTYLGNPPTPLPGALLLALPFHLAGNAAWQNLLWGPVFVFWCRKRLRPAAGLVAALLLLLAAPQALDDFVVGGDYLVGAIVVAIAADWCLRERGPVPAWARLLLLVLAVSSRPIYAVVPVVVTGVLWREHGWRRAVAFALPALVLLAALNLPFWLADPARFPTAHLAAKLDGLPHADALRLALPALALTLAATSFRLRIDPFAPIALALAAMLYPPFVAEALTGTPLAHWMWTASFSLPVSLFGTVALLRRFSAACAPAASPPA